MDLIKEGERSLDDLYLSTKLTLRNGAQINTACDYWKVDAKTKNFIFNFKEYRSTFLKSTLKLYAVYLLSSHSIPHSHNSHRFLSKHLVKLKDLNSLDQNVLEISSLYRNTNNEWQLWYLKDFYLWALKMRIPNFKKNIGESLSSIRISGNSKGRQVLSLDTNEGPLSENELNELIKALTLDESSRWKQERVYLWLSLILGANTRNILLLHWSDFEVISKGNTKVYLISVPRIKKRLIDRQDFKIRELDTRVGKILEDFRGDNISSISPIFISKKHDTYLNQSTLLNNIKRYILYLGINFKVTNRRLRYTFATRLVMNGVSKEKLSELLDHSDLQHVQIYYDLREKIKDFLSEAESKELGQIFSRFKGNVSSNDGQGDIVYPYVKDSKKSVLGKCGSDNICTLNPPFSCIVCSKFNAFSDSLDIYKNMLKFLVGWSRRRRDKYGENDRIHSLMHDVQLALGDLIQRIEAEEMS